MIDEFKYGFWIWSNKLNSILTMISHLVEYELSAEERELIKLDLRNTNDGKDNWSKFTFSGKTYSIELRLAYDEEEGSDMIHMNFITSIDLKEKLESLNLFQSMFKELIE